MKNLLLPFCMYTFLATAQPVIDEIDYRPQGQTFISARSAVPPADQKEGPAGFQTWDLSDLNGQMTNTTNHWGPDPDFPGTTFRRLTNLYGDHHIEVTNDGWYSHGMTNFWIFDDFRTIMYQDHLKLMSFPFTMSSSYTDTFSGTFSGMWATCSGTLTVEADGYGTLITPAGSWTNVLRVHSIFSCTAINDLGETDEYNRESYEWYVEGVAHELAGIHYLTVASAVYISGAYLISLLSVQEEELGKLFVFPNPAKGSATIKLESAENISSVTIADPSGVMHSLTFQQQGNELRIDVSGLADGIYYLHVRPGSGSGKYGVIAVGGF